MSMRREVDITGKLWKVYLGCFFSELSPAGGDSGLDSCVESQKEAAVSR
jgi:hypothetical protein